MRTSLRKHDDAFGQALRAYTKDTNTRYIVERDDGWFDVSVDPANLFSAHRSWPAYAKKGVSFARGRVLDVGCGAGRVALHLQNRGHEVVGIDNSPLAVKVCKERGVKNVKAMSITQVSTKLGTFDTIVMYGNNFGLFANAKRARWLLRRFHHMTSPNARIIAESLAVYQTKHPDHLAYHRRNRRRGRMAGQLRLRVRYHSCATPWFDYLIVSKDEMERLLAGTGWCVRRFFDSAGSMYIAVIEKDPEP